MVRFEKEVGPNTKKLINRLIIQGDIILAEIDDLRREVQETKDGFAAVAAKIDEIKAALEAAIAANAEVDGLKAAMTEAAGELDALQVTMSAVVNPAPEPTPEG